MVSVSLSSKEIAGIQLSVTPSWENKIPFIYSYIHLSFILLSAYYDSGTVLDTEGLKISKK